MFDWAGRTASADPPKAAAPTAQSLTDKDRPPPIRINGKTSSTARRWPAGRSPHFGGEGKVYVSDGRIVMEQGRMMTGITWTGEVIRNNYELTLEGMRLDGSDFFCTTTFPVGD